MALQELRTVNALVNRKKINQNNKKEIELKSAENENDVITKEK